MARNEFAIIEQYFRNLSDESVQVVKGPGDDCAVIQVAPGHELCVSTDTLLEGVHFPKGVEAEVVASRTLAANLSDLAAMGATPHAYVLALTMPDVDENWLSAFSGKLRELSALYNIPLVGGNLTKGPQLSLTITVMGQVPDGEAICRSGASPGDSVFVTGTLGDAAQGLRLLAENKPRSYLTDRYMNPTPRIEIGALLRGAASAMIDISDGLVADAAHIANESHVGVTLQLEDLPLSEQLLAAVSRDAALLLALSGGDDYELCFTAPSSSRGNIEQLSRDTGVPVSCVGSVNEGASVRVLDAAGVEVEASGYRHF